MSISWELSAGAGRSASDCWHLESPVARLVRDRLAQSPYLHLRTIKCQYENGALTLRGRVPSFYLWQLAWSLVSDLTGITRKIDQIEVVGLGTRRPAR